MSKANIVVFISALLIIGVTHANAFNVISSSTDSGLFENNAALSQYGIENCTNPKSPVYDSSVVNAYGNVPLIKNATQLDDFSGTLKSIRDISWSEIDFYPNGLIVRYGSDTSRGYFWIELYDNGSANYSDNETREIYNIIENYSTQSGIKNIPVVFTLTNETEIIGFAEYPVSRYDIDNNAIEETESESINYTVNSSLPLKADSKQTPALGLVRCLIIMFIVNLVGNRK